MNTEAFYLANVQRAANGCIHALEMAEEFPSMGASFKDIASNWSDSAFFWAEQWEWQQDYTDIQPRNAA